MRKGWEYKKLGEIGKIVTGSTPSTKDESNYTPREYCFVKPSDLPSQGIGDIEETEYYVSKVGLSKSRVLPAGSVLVSCIGSIGKIGILTKEACSNQQINAIIPQGVIDSRFIAYSLYAQRFVLESIANAPVVPIINKTDFSKIRIGIPPQSTQLAIVSELDKINELIRLKKEQLKDFDNLAQSLFYEMFGDPVENEKGWEVKKLGDVCTFSQGMQVPIENQKEIQNEGDVRFLRIIDFTQGKDAPRYVECDNDKYILHEKEIAIVRYGTPGFICTGKIGAIANNLFKLNPVSDNIFVFEYLVHWLSTDAFQLSIKGKQYGAALQAIKFSTIQNIEIILPPLPLQRLFAQRIEQIEREKSEVQKSIQDLETLLASRMQYWFE